MYKRILTIQDISCVGQCSLTVALPILSACGMETAILPSAVLSTHTGGFSGFTFRDLTEDIPAINRHWIKEGIKFDCIYTGYLGSTKQIGYVKEIFSTSGSKECVKIVDPAMADNGKLYSGFDFEYVEGMKTLCADADIILPNITEACFLTGFEYKESYDVSYINSLFKALKKITKGCIVLTGVSYETGKTGVAIYSNDYEYYCHERIPKSFHGTGDIFASAFTGAYMNGFSLFDSAVIAADYTCSCIKKTVDDPHHCYGVKFELVLSELIKKIYTQQRNFQN